MELEVEWKPKTRHQLEVVTISHALYVVFLFFVTNAHLESSQRRKRQSLTLRDYISRIKNITSSKSTSSGKKNCAIETTHRFTSICTLGEF